MIAASIGRRLSAVAAQGEHSAPSTQHLDELLAEWLLAISNNVDLELPGQDPQIAKTLLCVWQEDLVMYLELARHRG